MSFLNLKTKVVISIAALVVVGAIGFFTLDFGGRSEAPHKQPATAFLFDAEVVSEGDVVLGDGYRRFTHPEFGFSVEYPQELLVEGYKEEDGAETIVFQREGEDPALPSEEKMGFQVFVSPFGESEVLTKERILEDLPEAIIEDPQEVLLGTAAGDPSTGSGQGEIRALLFWSHSPKIGRTREVWFAHGSYLYEITTYAHLDNWLGKLLSTWQ